MLPLRRHSDLFLGDLGSSPGETGKVERQVLLEFCQSAWRGQHPLYLDRTIGMEVDAIEASIGGANLILRADSLLKQFLFNLDGVSGKGLFVTHSVLEGVETKKKAYRKSRTRTQTRSSRQVSHMVNFETLVDA